jgi:hypothetical protein
VASALHIVKLFDLREVEFAVGYAVGQLDTIPGFLSGKPDSS